MEQYRLYFLDGLGHILFSHEFEAADDPSAIQISESWREGRKMELWCRKRFVHGWARDDPD